MAAASRAPCKDDDDGLRERSIIDRIGITEGDPQTGAKLLARWCRQRKMAHRFERGLDRELERPPPRGVGVLRHLGQRAHHLPRTQYPLPLPFDEPVRTLTWVAVVTENVKLGTPVVG